MQHEPKMHLATRCASESVRYLLQSGLIFVFVARRLFSLCSGSFFTPGGDPLSEVYANEWIGNASIFELFKLRCQVIHFLALGHVRRRQTIQRQGLPPKTAGAMILSKACRADCTLTLASTSMWTLEALASRVCNAETRSFRATPVTQMQHSNARTDP